VCVHVRSLACSFFLLLARALSQTHAHIQEAAAAREQLETAKKEKDQIKEETKVQKLFSDLETKELKSNLERAKSRAREADRSFSFRQIYMCIYMCI